MNVELKTTGPSFTHRLRSLHSKPVGTLVIHEIYRSLQGESTFAGLPCVFVRLTACHLRCVYCDTPHAFHQGEPMTLDDVVARALELGDDLVEITGGEPLLQDEVYPLMTRLADLGKTVLLETSGAVDTSRGRSPGSGHPRPQDARLRRGRRERLEQPRPAQADRRAQIRPLRPRRFRLGCRRGPQAPPDRALSRPLQRRVRQGEPHRARRLDPRIAPSRPAPAPAAQDSLGSQCAGGVRAKRGITPPRGPTASAWERNRRRPGRFLRAAPRRTGPAREKAACRSACRPR